MTVDDLKRLHRDQFHRFETWRDETNGEANPNGTLYYGDLENFKGEVQATDYYMPDYCGGSDYSGNALEISNHRLFLEQFGTIPGVHNVHGGLGTFAVAILVSAINEDMLEVLAGLEDYPAIDDEDMSEIETEEEMRAWDSWARHDFIRLLTSKFPDLEEQIEALEDRDDNTLTCFFEEMREKANEDWENETGNSAWIHLEKIVEAVTEADIKEVCK
jgi:hypothetical protein